MDVEQRGALYAKLPYGRLDRSGSVLQEQLAGFGGLTCNTVKTFKSRANKRRKVDVSADLLLIRRLKPEQDLV